MKTHTHISVELASPNLLEAEDPESKCEVLDTFDAEDTGWAEEEAAMRHRNRPHHAVRIVIVTRRVVRVHPAQFAPEDKDDPRDPEEIGLPDHSRDNISFYIHD